MRFWTKRIICGYFSFLFKTRHRSDKGNLKDDRLAFESKSIHVSAHEDTSGLNNSKLSYTAHMRMWRSTNHFPEEAICTKPDTDTLFVFNPLMDNQGFVEVCSCEKILCMKKRIVNLFIVIKQLQEFNWELIFSGSI